MFPSSIDTPKSLRSGQASFGATRDTREMPKRVAHGGTAWAQAAEKKLYQPQDSTFEARSRVADIASRLHRMVGEPEDARLTGGTRSLMRRLSGLNVRVAVIRRAIPPQPAVSNLQLNQANVA